MTMSMFRLGLIPLCFFIRSISDIFHDTPTPTSFARCAGRPIREVPALTFSDSALATRGGFVVIKRLHIIIPVFEPD